MDFPCGGLRGGGILGNGVVEGDIETGILQEGTVEFHGLLAEVDTVAADKKTSEAPLYPCGIDKAIGIQLGIKNLQLADHDFTSQQGEQADIYDQTFDVGNGIEGRGE